MYLLNNDIILVKGAKNAAIYNLQNGNVYSIDEDGYEIILDYANGIISHSEYIELLKSNGILSDSFNIIPYNIIKSKKVSLNFVWLELTNGCNLRCLHCYEGLKHEKSQFEFKKEDWEKILLEILAAGCKNIQFIGGEPLLFPFVEDLITFSKQIGMEKITLFSNLNYLTESMINVIDKNNVKVRTSLYGHNAEIHDSITQVKGSFQKTVDSINKLMEKSVSVSPAVVIMKQNEQYINQIKDFIIKLGLTYNGYDVIRDVYGGTQSNFTPSRCVSKTKEMHKPNFSITKEMFERSATCNTCWYGKFAVSSFGEVYPCEFQRDIILGNLKNQTLQEILNSKEVDTYWYLDFSQIDNCKDCEFRFACRDCRSLGMSRCHNIYEKNPRCYYNPYKGQWE